MHFIDLNARRKSTLLFAVIKSRLLLHASVILAMLRGLPVCVWEKRVIFDNARHTSAFTKDCISQWRSIWRGKKTIFNVSQRQSHKSQTQPHMRNLILTGRRGWSRRILSFCRSFGLSFVYTNNRLLLWSRGQQCDILHRGLHHVPLAKITPEIV